MPRVLEFWFRPKARPRNPQFSFCPHDCALFRGEPAELCERFLRKLREQIKKRDDARETGTDKPGPACGRAGLIRVQLRRLSRFLLERRSHQPPRMRVGIGAIHVGAVRSPPIVRANGNRVGEADEDKECRNSVTACNRSPAGNPSATGSRRRPRSPGSASRPRLPGCPVPARFRQGSPPSGSL